MASTFHHDNVFILQVWKTLVVILFVIEDLPLEGVLSVEHECGALEGACVVISVNIVLTFINSPQVAFECPIILQVK